MAGSSAAIGGHANTFAATHRTDRWWAGPSATFAGLAILFGYMFVRAFHPVYVWADPYLSPVVAPPLFGGGAYAGGVPAGIAWAGAFPRWWPSFLPQSPAFFFPGFAVAFRATCYYYRKAYYRAFAATPPACAVRGAPLKYRGETALLLFQNLHRYALYGALFLLVCLWWEGFAAFFKNGRFGIGLGTIIMLVNAALLTGYTFGCHSWRHLIGGRLDCFSCDATSRSKLGIWKKSSWLNARHMQFAWISLFWVVFTDVYILLVASGRIKDLNTW
jgi:hypothetical protein